MFIITHYLDTFSKVTFVYRIWALFDNYLYNIHLLDNTTEKSYTFPVSSRTGISM